MATTEQEMQARIDYAVWELRRLNQSLVACGHFELAAGVRELKDRLKGEKELPERWQPKKSG